MKDKFCEIFKTGVHTDSSGRTRNWTIEDLNTMKDRFYKVHNNVPICCGHPKTNSPAYGWFKDVIVAGNSLFASFKDVLDEFKEAYSKGMFKNRSISLDPDLTIRHLAFLGGSTPAVKGLEQFCFSEENENDTIIEFCNVNFSNFPVNAKPTSGEKQFSPVSLQDTENNEKKDEEQKLMTEELQEKLKEKDEKIQALELELQKKEDEAQNKEFSDWADSMVKEGRILPAQKNSVIAILSGNKKEDFEFEDGAKRPVNDIFKEFVSGLKQIEFEDTATNKTAQDIQTIDFTDPKEVKNAIIEIQKEYENKGVSLTTAEAYGKIRNNA